MDVIRKRWGIVIGLVVVVALLFFGPLAYEIYTRRHFTAAWRVTDDYLNRVFGPVFDLIFGPVFGFVLIGVLLALYVLPTWIAYVRKHQNLVAVGILNVALGWTLLGWIAALVWAVMNTQTRNPNLGPAQTSTGQLDDTRPCPECAEPIKRAARRCKHCGSNVQPLA